MKKTIAIILLAATALSLFACGAKPSLVEMKEESVEKISSVILPTAQIEAEAFVKAYNACEVVRKANDKKDVSNDVIVVTYGAKDVFTLYRVDDDEFAVSGSLVEENYVIKSEELGKLYEEAVYPEAEFVELEAETYSVNSTKNPEAEIDSSPIVKAYNEAKFVGDAEGRTSSENLVIICNDGEFTFVLSYLEKDRFCVSGTAVKVPYIISSERLAELYNEIVK